MYSEMVNTSKKTISEKKIVTLLILMVEVVIDVPNELQMEFKMCMSCCSYCIGCCREQEGVLNWLASLKLIISKPCGFPMKPVATVATVATCSDV